MTSTNPGWGRRIAFSILTVLLTVTGAFVGGEVLVRLTVPEQTFWVVSNIYQRSEIPGVLYTYRPNYDGTAFSVALQTNSLGFRGPEWSRQKDPGLTRIALLGDSHAFGFGVSFENSVGEVLAATLKDNYGTPTEVLNFAVNGYNSAQQQAVLERIALGYDPDLVVVMPSSNDHQPPLQADNEGWLHWDGESSNPDSRMKDTFWQAFMGNSKWLLPKSRLLFYLKLVRERIKHQRDIRTAGESGAEKSGAGAHWMSPLPPGPVSERLAATVYAPMVAMVTRLKAQDTPVILAPFADFADYRQMFQILKQDHNVPILEVLLLFPEARSWKELIAGFGLGWDEHLNAVAHRRFAAGIAEMIQTRGYLQAPD